MSYSQPYSGTFIQKVLRFLLPRYIFEAIEEGTRTWILECPCGYMRDLWEAGGIKYKGTEQFTFAKCPECKKWSWHKKRKKTVEELRS